MRIAFFTDTYLPTINGVVTATEKLAAVLGEMGHEVLLVVPRPATEKKVKTPHERVQLEMAPSFAAPMYPDFRIATPQTKTIKLLQQFRPDIVHVHTPLTIGFEGVLGGKLMGVPLVHTFHTLFTHPDYLKHVGINTERIAEVVERGAWVPLRMFCRNFKVIVAPSEMIRTELYKRGIENSLTIPAIVDVEGFAAGAEKRKETAFPGKKTLIYVGRVSVEKNIHIVLIALQRLLKNGDDYRLVVVGDGPERSRLVNLAFDLGVSRAVSWYGGVAHERIKEEGVYKNGDVFISAGRAETFGLTAVEAQASGLPVIAVSSVGAREAVGEYGMLVKDGNDKELAERLSKGIKTIFTKERLKLYQMLAVKGAARYSKQAVYPQYERLYQSLAE